MNSKAQASLEYLITYGWALVIIATVVGVLVLVVSTPIDNVIFTSSDPAKILLKSSTADATTALAVLQNITGGQMKVSDLDESGSLSDCSIDVGSTIAAGQTMLLQCTYSGSGAGSVIIKYKNFANLDQTATISIDEGTEEEPPAYQITGTETCSDEYALAYSCSNSSDGSTITQWFGESSGPPKWIYGDLGSEKYISGIRTYIFFNDIPQTMNIDVSDDAVAWTNVVSSWTVTTGETWIEKTFTEIQGRYVRIYITNCKRSFCNMIEFEVLTRT